MKTKLLTLAAAAAISLGAVGLSASASAAIPAFNAKNLVTSTDSNVQNVYHRGHQQASLSRRCRRWYISGYRYGNSRARRMYNRYCRQIGGNSRRCRRWYILGYRYGNSYARRMYNRYCRGMGGLRYRCRKWYVAGFRYGNVYAKRLWYRYCARRPVYYPNYRSHAKPKLKIKIGF